jgi:hypothetical protein
MSIADLLLLRLLKQVFLTYGYRGVEPVGSKNQAGYLQPLRACNDLGIWQGRKDSNLRMAGSKPAALPLGYAPKETGNFQLTGNKL